MKRQWQYNFPVSSRKQANLWVQTVSGSIKSTFFFSAVWFAVDFFLFKQCVYDLWLAGFKVSASLFFAILQWPYFCSIMTLFTCSFALRLQGGQRSCSKNVLYLLQQRLKTFLNLFLTWEERHQATIHMHKSASFPESDTHFMSLKGTKMHWEIAVPGQKLLFGFFCGREGGVGADCLVCMMFVIAAFKWICKHEKHSHNINEKERLFRRNYYLLSMWIIGKFNFWSMNNILNFTAYESKLWWIGPQLFWTLPIVILLFGNNCHFKLV